MKQLSFVELAKINGGNDPTPIQLGDPDEVVEVTGGGDDHSNQDHTAQDV